MLAIIKTDMHL